MGTKTQFTDHFEAELDSIKDSNNTDLTELPALDFYKASILQSLKGNYDDIYDFINIQKALTRLMELNNEHLLQCADLNYKQ